MEDNSQIKIYLAKDGSVHKEISGVPIESLVFEGGGIRGVGYIGATRALFEAGIMQNVKRVTGSSAGAMTACSIAVGHTQQEIDDKSRNSDLTEWMGTGNLLSPVSIAKFLKNGYFNEGTSFLKKCREAGKERMTFLMNKYRHDYADNPEKLRALYDYHFNPERMTFQDLQDFSRLMPEAGIKDIYLVATRLPDKRGEPCEIKVFSAEHTPHVEINLAAMASCALPILFKPVEIDGSRYVDGGCIANYPIEVFNGRKYQPDGTYMFQGNQGQNYSTLGVKIDTPEEIEELLYAPTKDVSRRKIIMEKILDALVKTPTYSSSRKINQTVKNHYGHRTCQLSDLGIDWLNFKLSAEEKEELIQRDYDDMSDWIRNYYHGAIESRKFTSFAIMCECMDLDELRTFCDAMQKHPQDIIRKDDDCAAVLPPDDLVRYQREVKKILAASIKCSNIIRDHLSDLNTLLKKYNTDLTTIMSRLDAPYDMSETRRWIKSAEEAVKVVLGSGENIAVQKHDVTKLTEFIDAMKAGTELKKRNPARLFEGISSQKFHTSPTREFEYAMS